jgi:predicted extracellular nuclease
MKRRPLGSSVPPSVWVARTLALLLTPPLVLPPIANAAPITAPPYAVQGSGGLSPLVGRVVATSGVVTKRLKNGFFLQDLIGDNDPATSDGLFVFTSTAPPTAAEVGNMVRVTGTVAEFSAGARTIATPLTEINRVTAVSLMGTGYTITPARVTLPLATGDSLERFEGMLVRIEGALTVQQNYFQGRYGQLTVGAGGRHETPTNRHRPGSPQASALANLQARSRLLLDDGSSEQNVNPTPYLGANGVPRAGDRVSNLVGVLDYGLATSSPSGAGLYRLQPTDAPVFAVANKRTSTPPAVGGNVKLASMNVLNFFTTFTDGTTASGQSGQGCTLGGSSTSARNCRGADNLAEFQRQRAKIVAALAGLNADAIGLMELQNNGDAAVQNLADALNAQIGARTYAVVPTPPQGTGDDAIRVAMIYKPARLTPVGASASDPASINHRPPLAQTFAHANDERFTLIVNHLKSKSSCPAAGGANAAGNTDTGDGQGCWNAQRVQQVQQLRTFVAQMQARAGSDDVLLIGDFNAYAQEDPIHNLTSSSYIDQPGRFATGGYSYVFDGMAGQLDHAIATPTLSAKVTGAAHWHIDADEGLQQDYNLEFKQPACATCAPDLFDGNLPFRASDHDPVLLGLNLSKSNLLSPRAADLPDRAR